MLITEDYIAQNKALHVVSLEYGTGSIRWVDQVTKLCETIGTKDVLDYGCGKAALVYRMRDEGYSVQGYDPALEPFAGRPEPADVVVCTDVLEHIEPDCINAVLDDLRDLTKKAAFFVVSTRPARKVLPDGRNAHLIQAHSNQWLAEFMRRFVVTQFIATPHGLQAIVLPK